MKKFIALAVIAAAAAAAVFWQMERSASVRDDGTIKIFGNVEIREALMSFRVPGRIRSMLFEEGMRVASGDLVATMDDDQYEATVREARAALDAAEATASKLRAGYETDDIRAARAARDQVAASLRNAESNLKRIGDLRRQNVVAQKDYDDASAARDSLRAALTASESTLHRLSGGFRPEDIAAAEAQVSAAQARLDRAMTALDDTKLYAAADGTILTRVMEPGTMTAAGAPVYTMMLASPIQVRAYLSERHLGRVSLGMTGRIIIDSHPDEPITGTLSFIAPDAEFTPKQVQTEDIRATLVYRVRLLVTGEHIERLKNGMPVTVLLDGDKSE